MVGTLRLVLCHLVLRLVASWDTLLLSPGSPVTSVGFHQTLTLDLTKHNSRDKDSKAQTFCGGKHSKTSKVWKFIIDIFFT